MSFQNILNVEINFDGQKKPVKHHRFPFFKSIDISILNDWHHNHISKHTHINTAHLYDTDTCIGMRNQNGLSKKSRGTISVIWTKT